MLIGIISDTHDNAKNLLKAFDMFNKRKVDLILHLGDWVSPNLLKFSRYSDTKIISIFGNNEHKHERYPEEAKKRDVDVEFIGDKAELQIDNRKFYLVHGDIQEELDSIISSGKYDVVLSGHNHLAKIDLVGKTIHINPGSTCGIKRLDVDHELTIALYDTSTDKAEIIYLD